MLCKRCGSDQAYIQQADDSFLKEVFCPVCKYKTPLKFYNKKSKLKN